MSITKNWVSVLITSTILISGFSPTILESGQFISPSKKQLDALPLGEIKKAYGIRKIPFPTNINFEEITKQEKTGFIGYHGDSLDFLIYQDIIRIVLEVIVETPVRNDFHFLAVPLDPALKIQTKEDLAQVFNGYNNTTLVLQESTFPMNFSIWDNANRLGLNSVEHFAKNESTKPLGYKKRLKWLFNQLGIDEKNIDRLYDEAYKKLPPSKSTGIILQIFDESETPYAFSQKIAYPSYPNGFLAENRTVDEYYLDEGFAPPYPHEVRLLLNNHETLNPSSPLKIVRHVPSMTPEALKSYEGVLNSTIKKLPYDKKAKEAYRNNLQKSWGF